MKRNNPFYSQPPRAAGRRHRVRRYEIRALRGWRASQTKRPAPGA